MLPRWQIPIPHAMQQHGGRVRICDIPSPSDDPVSRERRSHEAAEASDAAAAGIKAEGFPS